MRLREIMIENVETVPPWESGAAALERMRRGRFHHLVVCDRGKVLGVLSDRDVAAMGTFGQVETVEEIMSEPPLTAAPDTTLRKAANLLRGRKISCLPVLDEGKLVGIITTTDLLDLVGKGVERPVPKTPKRGGSTRKRAPAVRRSDPESL